MAGDLRSMASSCGSTSQSTKASWSLFTVCDGSEHSFGRSLRRGDMRDESSGSTDMDRIHYSLGANKALEATPDGTVRSAVADGAFWLGVPELSR